MKRRCLILLLLAILAALSFGGLSWYRHVQTAYQPVDLTTLPQAEEADQFTVLTANVGNSIPQCQPYFWKLCLKAVEEKIRKNLRLLSPDLVVLQELLPESKCLEPPTQNPNLICSETQMEHQARRLLGQGYTVICDGHLGMQCIGVKQGFAVATGCPAGQTCLAGGYEPAGFTLPPAVDCDPNFTVFSINLTLTEGSPLSVVNIHLNSRSDPCRTAVLTQILDEVVNPLGLADRVLLLGDFNLDLERYDDESTALLNTAADGSWAGRGISLHDPLDETGSPVNTFQILTYQRTLDHVLSNCLRGKTVVLGKSSGTDPLDGGWGMDHFAVYGVFEFKKP